MLELIRGEMGEWEQRDGARKQGRERAVGVRDTKLTVCVCWREGDRERERRRGGIEIVSTRTLQTHSLDPLRAAPWRMTMAVFSLPHSFS